MNRFAAIHQFHPGTAHGDAITQQMLRLQDHFLRIGIRSEIFAEHMATGLQDRIQSHPGIPGVREEPVVPAPFVSVRTSSTRSSACPMRSSPCTTI